MAASRESLILVARHSLLELLEQCNNHEDGLPASLTTTIIELHDELVAQGEDMSDVEGDIQSILSELAFHAHGLIP